MLLSLHQNIITNLPLCLTVKPHLHYSVFLQAFYPHTVFSYYQNVQILTHQYTVNFPIFQFPVLMIFCA